jgi:branched-chain amino acid transport system substrate-binding protein
LKKFLFLTVGILLAIGLILPGCSGGGGGGGTVDSGYHGLAKAGYISIGVLGDYDYIQGWHALDGANLAKTDLGTSITLGTETGIGVNIVKIDTNEVDSPGGTDGTTAVTANLAKCDFMVGGFRTEGVVGYMPLIMAQKMVYIDCGAATESLCQDVVSDYNTNKYFFRGTPPNDYLLAVMLGKLNDVILGEAEAAHPFVPKIAVVAENATWTQDPVAITMNALINSPLGDITVSGIHTAFEIPSVPTIDSQVTSVLATIPNTANIIITILSGPCGITFQNHIRTYFPHALIMGINVEAQNSNFPNLLTNPSLAEGLIIQDAWVPGVSQTSETATFLSEFAAAYSTQNGGDYGSVPIYTAGTYDAVKYLVTAAESKAKMSASTPAVVEWLPDDIVSYLETNVAETAGGITGYYPKWDGTTMGTFMATSVPALSEAQVLDLYPWLATAKFSDGSTISDWAYDPDDWTMPYHPSHDLVFASPYDSTHAANTGIASQWQSGVKVCIWPTRDLTYAGPLAGLYNITTIQEWEGFLNTPGVIPAVINATTLEEIQGAGLWDQYGWWNFAYPGTGHLDLTDFIAHLP